MKQPFFSLRYRIAGLTFLLIAMTVCSLLYLANQQMQSLFAEYLRMPMGPMMGGMGMHSMHMGQNELHFLHSVHQSLIWVGLLFMVSWFFGQPDGRRIDYAPAAGAFAGGAEYPAGKAGAAC